MMAIYGQVEENVYLPQDEGDYPRSGQSGGAPIFDWGYFLPRTSGRLPDLPIDLVDPDPELPQLRDIANTTGLPRQNQDVKRTSRNSANAPINNGPAPVPPEYIAEGVGDNSLWIWLLVAGLLLLALLLRGDGKTRTPSNPGQPKPKPKPKPGKFKKGKGKPSPPPTGGGPNAS